MKFLLLSGLSLSFLVGIWHFFIPSIFHWYQYIPENAYSLKVGIIWTNFFFSLLLSGLSLLLLVFHKSIGKQNSPLLWIYGFLTLVWFTRVILTIFLPMQGYDIIFWGSISAFTLIFFFMLIPSIYIIRRNNSN